MATRTFRERRMDDAVIELEARLTREHGSPGADRITCSRAALALLRHMEAEGRP
jgi:hypothetical protein